MGKLWSWGQQRRACLAPRLLCQGLNWALCVLINLEARVTVLALLAFQNAKSKRQLRGKRKLILFSELNCFSGYTLSAETEEKTRANSGPGYPCLGGPWMQMAPLAWEGTLL